MSGDPVVVMHVIGTLNHGGVERRLLTMIQESEQRELKHVVVCLSGRVGVLAVSARGLGAEVIPVRNGPFKFYRLLRLMRSQNVDVIHSRVATFSGVVCALAFVAGVKGRIAQFHSDGDDHGDSFRYRVQRRVARVLTALFATHVLGVSPAALRFSGVSEGVARLTCKKAYGLLPGGVDKPTGSTLVAHSVEQRERPEVIHVGRDAVEKRREMAARAVSLLPFGILTIVGDKGADVEKFRDDPAIVESRCEFVGVSDQVSALIRRADVLITTSSREGLPGVILEALAVGTPVVASNLSGARWIAAELPGVSLVDVGAGPEVWADAISVTVTGELSREELSSAFMQSRFCWDNVWPAYRSLYLDSSSKFIHFSHGAEYS